VIIFLYLKFPEEIPNEQSAMPKRETLFSPDLRDRLLKVMKNNPPSPRHWATLAVGISDSGGTLSYWIWEPLVEWI
jgi:hypothetical protein